MSRLGDQDFQRLKEYLQSYSLSNTLDSAARAALVRRAHRHNLAALQMWAALERAASEGQLTIGGVPVQEGSEQFAQISESFSDLTSGLFLAIHGTYKPAHMSLRSASESFTRGLASITSAEALNTTSIYRLFEIAKTTAVFTGRGKPHFETLHQQYSLLCAHTHSDRAHLIRNHAMSSFPRHDIDKLREWVRALEKICISIISVLVFANRQLYLSAPPKAQDVYEETLPAEPRLFALGAPE